ncbi:SIP domain-containing protein, partial [Streptomyces sp. MBT57]|nr:SIP domain-containing protein [Streptomyces sp. MBT57]
AAALEAAVRALPLPPGEGYAWAAAESRALLPVRRYLQRERELPKDRLNITGYWHREEATDPEAEGTADAGAAAQGPAQIPSPLPWLVARAALQLGVVDAVADAPGLLPGALAARLGVPGPRIDVLLPLLATYGVVVVAADDGAGLRLGPAGEELLD